MPSKTYSVKFGGGGYYNINNFLNPTLYLGSVENGQTATFNILATRHPFYIKDSLGAGSAGAYSHGVSTNGIQNGQIVLTKTAGTPDVLYYQCGNHSAMWGTIKVRDLGHGAAPQMPATTTSAPATTSPPQTTTPSPTTTEPPENPPTTTTPPPGDENPNRPTSTTGSGYGGGGGSTINSMISPDQEVYGNSAYQFRWGSKAYNAGATWDMTNATIAQNINDNASSPYHAMGSRSYNHYGEISIAEDELSAEGVRAEYPAFHKPKKHKWHGVNMYHATAGPNYNSNWHESFSVRSETGRLYTIADIVRDPSGGYKNKGNRGNGTKYARSPLHPVYNSNDEHHDYPYAHVHNNDSDFHENLPVYNGERANPLSKAASLGPTYGLIFSRFYHYDATLKEGPVGFINHNGLNGAGEGSTGFTYKVTATEPISRKASGGQYKSLEKISTWSPYSGAYYLDFTNFNAYNKQLFKSSIWK